MFTPHSLAVALLMMITSAICWGSWANTYKGVKNYRFELFYWDYVVGVVFGSLCWGLTLGNWGGGSLSFIANIRQADGHHILLAIVGGAVSVRELLGQINSAAASFFTIRLVTCSGLLFASEQQRSNVKFGAD